MSTYFFRTNIHGLGNMAQVKAHLDRWEQSKEIDTWHIDMTNPESPLQIVTQQLTPDQVKHRIRELGVDADFIKPPETRDRGDDRTRGGRP
ncbi:hypothetical protein [Flaviaesturariibacter amylovorans]|uniref:Uncharacterized protein n=1 Tax=Flaviaesturariibacter amylovorans TaxID=1084520 RepID=A0ABP8GHQ1_9BACT